MTGTRAPTDILLISVHGPAGVVDLAVASSATAADVAEEYADQAALGFAPILHSGVGVPLQPAQPLDRAGVGSGDVLVATAGDPARAAARPGRRARHEPAPTPVLGRPGAAATLRCAVSAAAAGLAGWTAVRAPDERLRTATLVLLVAAAVLGVLPGGRRAAHRALAAPSFGGAAAFVAAGDPHDGRLPMVVGATALGASLTAAVGRSLGRDAEEALRVWMVAGCAVAVATGPATLGGAPPRVVWAVLLVLAVLAARFVPALAVDVPDQDLLDLERLAVTAWSARQQPGRRRRPAAVPVAEVEQAAARGARLVTAAATAVLAVTAVSAPLLLASAVLPVDRVGARCLVGLAGAALLLAARSRRHAGARALLRGAGLVCWTALLVVLLRDAGRTGLWWLGLGPLALGAALVVAAVATGRGWRSAWWSRRAEVAEGLCGALAVATLVVAAGWFRQLWELTSLWKAEW